MSYRNPRARGCARPLDPVPLALPLAPRPRLARPSWALVFKIWVTVGADTPIVLGGTCELGLSMNEMSVVL